MYDDTAPAGDLVRGLGAHDLGKPLVINGSLEQCRVSGKARRPRSRSFENAPDPSCKEP